MGYIKENNTQAHHIQTAEIKARKILKAVKENDMLYIGNNTK